MQNLRALVTGGTGYIGSHLVLRLHELGWVVNVIVRKGSNKPHQWESAEGLKVYEHDGSTSAMINIIDESKPDVIFNLASIAKYNYLSGDVDQLIASNILFPTQVLEAMKVCGVKCIVNAETFWQYAAGNASYRPTCLYAATKQAFRDIIYNYVDNNSFKAISLVLYDVYGPNDPREKLIKLLSRYYLSGEELLMTKGEQIILMVHIKDVVSAFIQASSLLFKQDKGTLRVYSVASQGKLTLRNLIDEVMNKHNLRIKIKWGGKPYRDAEIMRPWVGELLPGWHPTVSDVDEIGSLIASNHLLPSGLV